MIGEAQNPRCGASTDSPRVHPLLEFPTGFGGLATPHLSPTNPRSTRFGKSAADSAPGISASNCGDIHQIPSFFDQRCGTSKRLLRRGHVGWPAGEIKLAPQVLPASVTVVTAHLNEGKTNMYK